MTRYPAALRSIAAASPDIPAPTIRTVLEDEAAIDEVPQNAEEPRSRANRQNERRVIPFSDPIELARSLGVGGIFFIARACWISTLL